MLRQALTAISVITICVCSFSCNSLRSQNYVGEKANITQYNISKDSMWLFDDTVFHVRLVGTNLLVASSVVWDEKNKKHDISTKELIISELKGYTFLNLKDGQYYTILRLIPTGEDSLVLATVDAGKIDKDIAEGKIKATKEQREFTFKGSKKELDDYVSDNIDSLFDYDALGALRLLSGELK